MRISPLSLGKVRCGLFQDVALFGDSAKLGLQASNLGALVQLGPLHDVRLAELPQPGIQAVRGDPEPIGHLCHLEARSITCRTVSILNASVCRLLLMNASTQAIFHDPEMSMKPWAIDWLCPAAEPAALRLHSGLRHHGQGLHEVCRTNASTGVRPTTTACGAGRATCGCMCRGVPGAIRRSGASAPATLRRSPAG